MPDGFIHLRRKDDGQTQRLVAGKRGEALADRLVAAGTHVRAEPETSWTAEDAAKAAKQAEAERKKAAKAGSPAKGGEKPDGGASEA